MTEKNQRKDDVQKKHYSIGDEVSFRWEDTIKKGRIFVVDANGTFEYPNLPSYDIMVDSENTLYKHITWGLVM